MISVEEAYSIVVSQAIKLGIEEVALSEAVGRVLAEHIYIDRPLPPYDRVCMDGIAIKHESFSKGNRDFRNEKIVAAGDPRYTLIDKDSCVEIMTGAVLPNNADTVIRYEDLRQEDDRFLILIEPMKGANIHYKGSDLSAGELILKQSTKLKAIDINMLASVGKAKVKVIKHPKTVLISSGNELIDIDQRPEGHQIRKSNVYMLQARLLEMGIASDLIHFEDDFDHIVDKLREISEGYELVILSGGVSKGKFDFIPSALKEVGFNKLFHGVEQRPGKPFWFGRKNNCVVFALPGNPVSSLVCFHKYIKAWIDKSLNTEGQSLMVRLATDISFKPNLSYFAEAKLEFKADGSIEAEVVKGNGSGDIVNPTRMHGFIELPVGSETYYAGECFQFHPFFPIFN